MCRSGVQYVGLLGTRLESEILLFLLLLVGEQVFYNAGDDQSFFEYDRDELENSQGSFLHDLSELEVEGDWARFR